MKIILVGYPGSQFLVPASKYLTNKYLPFFDIRYLNHTGPKEEWSKFVREYLIKLRDKHIIFALDDYLISEPINGEIFDGALRGMLEHVACAKLHRTNQQEHDSYPVTTQYSIWDRKFLVELLSKTTDPWNFEMHGSALMHMMKEQSLYSPNVALEYYTSSALSKRWKGVRWDGVSNEDLEYIKTNLMK